ncbi:type II toxin-antitoxin system VapB family antitoxin [Agrobacterium sp. a22-2]|uniref:type II toxin-antitoxin system VapB family antitoxin n=1 Tax=Agrobacterium sp. a22-2 TaxID=2283840 RepID=UPI0014487A0C|nr:type II toxin-antitoxin system VapB family antitoxin [Agrobacterium sp. a22-2]NKN37887.1 type II toxin-antitoxin system VapB family antitoxin [Agrobacterium sp. a22-2]
MRTTITIDDQLLADAKEFTGIQETSAVMKEALTALVKREARRRLIALGGNEPDFAVPPRRRWNPDGTFGAPE